MRPLKFHPILKQTLWGGERIIPYKELASGLSRVGESWELSGMPGSESVVAEGPWAGSTLSENFWAKPTMPVSGRNFPCW